MPGAKLPEDIIQHLLNATQFDVWLSTLKGKLVMLNFWASWCVPRVKNFPKLGEMQMKFGSDLHIIAVSDESPHRVATFIKHRPVSIKVCF